MECMSYWKPAQVHHTFQKQLRKYSQSHEHVCGQSSQGLLQIAAEVQPIKHTYL
jgi:hypothetical protein